VGVLKRHAQRRCKPCFCKRQNARNQVLTRFNPRLPDATRRSRLMSVGVLPTRLPMRLPCGLVTACAFDICIRAILSESFAISHFLFLCILRFHIFCPCAFDAFICLGFALILDALIW